MTTMLAEEAWSGEAPPAGQSAVTEPAPSGPATRYRGEGDDKAHQFTQDLTIGTLRHVEERWCIFIDILGFGWLWEMRRQVACDALAGLTWSINQIAKRAYCQPPHRIFAHQFGDGFAIVNEPGAVNSLERPVAIAIALMRHVASVGALAAAAVSEGDFADIQSLIPSLENGGVCPYACGLKTKTPVMGTAFIRAHAVHRATRSGPFLTLSNSHKGRIAELPFKVVTRRNSEQQLLSVNWLTAESRHLDEMQNKTEVSLHRRNLNSTVKGYYQRYKEKIGDKWRPNLRDHLDITV